MENDIKRGFSEKQKWVFVIVFNLILLGIGYKLIFSDYSIDLSNFKFSDLLALLLALFSIGISVAFYFKATDSSNLFYDNTYKFTKDIAQLLVKIESSFGEKLAHLDEGYVNIRERFDNFPKSLGIDIEKAKKELEQSDNELKKKQEEREKLLNESLQKSHTNEKERQLVIDELKQKELELIKENENNRLLKDVLFSQMHKDMSNATFIKINPDTVNWLKTNILTKSNKDILFNSKDDVARAALNGFLQDIPKDIKQQLFKGGVLDWSYQLSAIGFSYLKILATT